jgi:predicted acyltransferase
MTAPALSTKSSRLQSLDILRGLAIFGMIFSSYIPEGLPRWMHHDQYMNGDELVIILGLTWVDIVFPIFLFSLGMAIPFALAKRIEEKMPMWQVVVHIFWRALVICGFGYFLGNASAWNIADPWTWIRTLLGFACLVLFLARMPFIPEEKKILKLVPKIVGLAGLFILMATVRHADGKGFTTEYSDIIILILSQVYLTASLVWLVSRKSIPLRLAILAGIFAMRLHGADGGQILVAMDNWLSKAHLGWFYWASIIYVSTVAIFGSIIGDIIYQWSKERKDVTEGVGLPAGKLAGLLVALPSLTVGGLYFLQMRYVTWGLIFTAAVCLLIHWLVKDTLTSMGSLVQRLCKWMTFLLIVGYILEPFEGGIKKDPATLSYYFIPSGMAVSLLTFFLIVIDDLKWRKGIGFLRVAGSNAMLAYITGGLLITPILFLTHLIKPIEKFSERNLTSGTIWAVGFTMFILFVVNIFTRRKIYLRV